MSEERLDYIDLIKGFGIFLVILGHAMIPRSPWIYSFHVPLFFFISGFMYKDRPFKANLASKLKKMYFPFVTFNVVTWLFFYLIAVLNHDTVAHSTYLNLYRTIIGFDISVPQNGPLWFLLCLFTVSVIYIFISLLKNEYLKLAAVLAVTVSGYFISQRFSDLPFKIEAAMMMIFFFYAGNLSCRFKLSEKIDRLKGIAIFNISVLFSYLNFILNYYNLRISGIERISVLENSYGNIFLFYISAFCAILFTAVILKKIGRIGIINYLGMNSLIILCIHYPILQYVERIHPAFLGSSILFDLISSLITVVLCVPVIYLISRIKLHNPGKVKSFLT